MPSAHVSGWQLVDHVLTMTRDAQAQELAASFAPEEQSWTWRSMLFHVRWCQNPGHSSNFRQRDRNQPRSHAQSVWLVDGLLDGIR